MDMRKEFWKEIPNFEGFYEASNLGRIRSMSRQIKTRPHGRWYLRTIKSTLLKEAENGFGYKVVGLCKKGVVRHYKVQRLIASAFIPNPDKKSDTNHKSGDKGDNSVKNLEWVTRGENHKHAFRMGLRRRPKGKRKLNEKKVRIIKIIIKLGFLNIKDIAELFCVKGSCISNIKHGHRWGYV